MNTKTIIKRLSFLVMVSAAAAFLTGASAAKAESKEPPHPYEITEKKSLVVVGADRNYPPFEFLDEEGTPVGFNIDLLKALADVMGLELQIKSGYWSEIRDAIENRELDMVSGMFYSPERDNVVDFSVPFLTVYQSLFIRKGTPIHSIEDLQGKEVIVQRGDIMHDYVASLNLTDKIIPVDDTVDGLRLLASGKHDCALLSKLQGQYLLKKYGITNVTTAGYAMLDREYCFAVANGDERLLSRLDQGLKILKAAGKYKDIREKWFGVIEKSPLEKYVKIAGGVLAALLVLQIGSLLWNRSLRRHVRIKTRELETELNAHEHTLVALKDREAHLRALVESSSDAILTLDKQKFMVDCNPAFVRLLGHTKNEIEGKSLKLILPVDANRKRFENAVFNLIEKEGAWRDEWEFTRKDGSIIHMETTISEKILPDGRVEGYVAIMRDITKRKLAEKEKSALESQLQNVQKMEAIGALAGGIAHDFNNILSSIIGYTELSRRALPEESPINEDLYEVLDAADKAKALVRQILTYSRQSDQERRPVSLNTIIKGAVRLLWSSLPSSIEINVKIDADPDTVLADPTQVHQVLLNLATNAVHAIGKNSGVLDIELHDFELKDDEASSIPAAVPGEHLELTVRDNGHGMDQSIMDRIFDPFFTTKGRGEGTGMGLSVVHGIVKDHGGLIRVESELGKGTAFQVILPKYMGSADMVAEPEGRLIGGNERILMVDDDDRVLNAWKRILTALGYDVVAVTSPLDAIKVFREKATRIDLVITDLTMPIMHGVELAERLMKEREDIPVILYTGFSEAVDEEMARAAGIDTFLHKPITTSEMADAIRSALSHSFGPGLRDQ